MHRRHFLLASGSLLSLIAAGCDDPAPGETAADPLDTGPVLVDELTALMEGLLAGSGYEDRAGELAQASEDARAELEALLPGAAALLATGLNQLAVPLLTGLTALVEDPEQDAFGAQIEALADGMRRVERILPTVEAEIAEQGLASAGLDLDALAPSLGDDRALLQEAIDTLGLQDEPFTRPALALSHQTHRERAVGDPSSALSELQGLVALGPVGAKLLSALAKAPDDRNDECGTDDNLKAAWYAGSWLWSLVRLVMLVGGGAAATGLVGALMATWLGLPALAIFLILLLWTAKNVITKAPQFIDEVQECHCSLNAGGE